MIATRTLGFLAAAWAASYLPIHVYWALGGTSTPIGITGDEPAFRAANWGACVVIAGAGLTALALTQRWGVVLPARLRRGTAWVGGSFGLLHWLVYSTLSTLRLTGAVGYPRDGDATPSQLRHFDWANVGYFELWFGVMGVLLIACARRNRALELVRMVRPHLTRPVRVGTALAMAGVAAVVAGVFTFQPWIFAGGGPVLLGVGLLTIVLTNRERSFR